MTEGELRGGPIAPTFTRLFLTNDFVEVRDRVFVVSLLKQVHRVFVLRVVRHEKLLFSFVFLLETKASYFVALIRVQRTG
jgi:hypothetical protein